MRMKQSPTSEIEAAAVDAALAELIAVRPDLNKNEALALARLVGRVAASETTNGLRRAGYFDPPPITTATASPINSRLRAEDVIEPLIEPLIESGFAIFSEILKKNQRHRR
jgi:hypothetical protein